MKNRRNYYRLLQVQPDAPVQVLRSAFRTLMRELKQHPDLGGSNAEAALLIAAYDTLSDPTKRAAYDREFLTRSTRQESGGGAAGRSISIKPSCPFCKTPLARKAGVIASCPVCRSPLRSQATAEMNRSYRRSVQRLKNDSWIYYCSSWPQKARRAMMIDLSPKGIRFSCGERLLLGSVLKIDGPVFEGTARVTNVRSRETDGEGLYTVGASFLAVRFDNPKGTFLSTSV